MNRDQISEWVTAEWVTVMIWPNEAPSLSPEKRVTAKLPPIWEEQYYFCR